MLSIEKSKKILNKGERQYTDEEVKQVRDTLSLMAELQIETEKWREQRDKESAEKEEIYHNINT